MQCPCPHVPMPGFTLLMHRYLVIGIHPLMHPYSPGPPHAHNKLDVWAWVPGIVK
jgi:hypothetical protein